ncbi:hypothetical protein COBT_000695 [Conglomerata obtusa]
MTNHHTNKDTNYNSGIAKLNSELYSLYFDLQPYIEENDTRNMYITSVRKAIYDQLGAKTMVYGSFECGLALPGSDVDLVVTFGNDEEVDNVACEDKKCANVKKLKRRLLKARYEEREIMKSTNKINCKKESINADERGKQEKDNIVNKIMIHDKDCTIEELLSKNQNKIEDIIEKDNEIDNCNFNEDRLEDLNNKSNQQKQHENFTCFNTNIIDKTNDHFNLNEKSGIRRKRDKNDDNEIENVTECKIISDAAIKNLMCEENKNQIIKNVFEKFKKLSINNDEISSIEKLTEFITDIIKNLVLPPSSVKNIESENTKRIVKKKRKDKLKKKSPLNSDVLKSVKLDKSEIDNNNQFKSELIYDNNHEGMLKNNITNNSGKNKIHTVKINDKNKVFMSNKNEQLGKNVDIKENFIKDATLNVNEKECIQTNFVNKETNHKNDCVIDKNKGRFVNKINNNNNHSKNNDDLIKNDNDRNKKDAKNLKNKKESYCEKHKSRFLSNLTKNKPEKNCVMSHIINPGGKFTSDSKVKLQSCYKNKSSYNPSAYLQFEDNNTDNLNHSDLHTARNINDFLNRNKSEENLDKINHELKGIRKEIEELQNKIKLQSRKNINKAKENETKKNKENKLEELKKIKKTINKLNFVDQKSVIFIKKAKVPIIKFKDKKFDINIDISVDASLVKERTDFIKSKLLEMEILKPLCFIIKYYLKVRNLNDAGKKGLCSYAQFLMAYHFCKLHPVLQISNTFNDLGLIFMDFLHFYGFNFNYTMAALDISNSCYVKKDIGDDLICILDPFTKSNIATSCALIHDIKDAFSHGYKIMSLALKENKAKSFTSLWIFQDEDERKKRLDNLNCMRKLLR